ncbi:hypothetical protein NDA01_29920 [Trichocoleus desertorum AS-A10]|uniref:hypothetical protein n=1 Tax=Trichocoleus desertorum TaxID=1481672 RepID=UPI00329B67A9
MFPFFTHCTPANVSDDAGLVEMLRLNIDYFKSKPVNIPKITILLDHGYHIDYLIEELEKIYPQIMTKIRFVACFPKGTFDQTLETREGSARKIWICPSSSEMGYRTIQCLDGAV